MTLALLPSPDFTGADLAARVNAATQEARAARRFASVAALLADATLAYGGTREVAPGDRVQTAEGFAYEVAAAAAADHHVATAGGVKLYVRPGADGSVNVLAFGAVDALTGNSSTQLQAAFNAVANTETLLVIPRGTFRSGLALSALGVRRLRMDGVIQFYGTTDGLTIGRTSSTTDDMARCDLRVRVEGVRDVAGTTGIICRGMWRSEVTAHVDGFEVGFEHRMPGGNNEYVAGCTFRLTLRNCRVKLRFNSAAPAFCSDNRYPGLVALRQNETLTPSIGVEWASNTAPSNNNVFDKAWLEGNDTPIRFAGECGFNKFHDARLESAGPVVFTTGGSNGGACGNLVTSDITGAGNLSFWQAYTSDSPFPNFVDSGLFASERTLVTEITHRDWHHRTTVANRNWLCPKLVSKLYGNAGGFAFGPDYFDWATVDDATRSFTITNNDEGWFDVPVEAGEQFFLGLHHDTASVAATATVVRLEALDAAKAALPALAAGQLPYIGTTRTSPAGHSGTGNTVALQNDRARQSTGLRVNRAEVRFLRVVLRPGVRFYKVDLFALHDRHSRPRPGALHMASQPFKYIDNFSEAPDHNGQIARLRGVEVSAIAFEGKWRGLGFKKGRVSLVAGTATIPLGYTESSTAYSVLVSGYAQETLWVSAKTTTDFTIRSSNAASTSQVEYILLPN